MSIKYLNLKNEDYNSQRDNPINPGVECMPTANDMFYKGNGFTIQNFSNLPDDSYMMWLLNTYEAKEFCYRKFPWSILNKYTGKPYPPNEVHGMYNGWLDVKVVGKRISDFKTDLSWDDFIARIINGEVLWTSGAFQEAGIDGHAFCIIGYGEDGNLRIADPWGQFPKYADHNGYNVIFTYDDFINRIFPIGESKKWGHVLV